MSWLRIDDKFGQHPKVLGLSDREFRVHVLTLCYCAEYRTDGHVPKASWRLLGITPKTAEHFVNSGIWDTEGDEHHVHDWRIYNAETVSEKVDAYLSKNPDATANEVFREVGGKREIVLAVVADWKTENDTQAVPESVPQPVPEQYPGGTQSVHARALPVPSPTPTQEQDLACEVSDVTEKPFVVFPSLEARPHDDDENRKRNEGVNYLAQPRDPDDERLRPIERITASAALFKPGHILLPDDH